MPEILAALAEGDADLTILLDRLGMNDAQSRVLLSQRLEELVATGLVAQA